MLGTLAFCVNIVYLFMHQSPAGVGRCYMHTLYTLQFCILLPQYHWPLSHFCHFFNSNSVFSILFYSLCTFLWTDLLMTDSQAEKLNFLWHKWSTYLSIYLSNYLSHRAALWRPLCRRRAGVPAAQRLPQRGTAAQHHGGVGEYRVRRLPGRGCRHLFHRWVLRTVDRQGFYYCYPIPTSSTGSAVSFFSFSFFF